jgi:hypothetical protein
MDDDHSRFSGANAPPSHRWAVWTVSGCPNHSLYTKIAGLSDNIKKIDRIVLKLEATNRFCPVLRKYW